MGMIFSSDQKNESIINLSDKCVSRITKEDQNCANKKPNKEEDGEWITKLKCMDDIHTQENGLTLQCVLDLILKIETRIQNVGPTPVCDTLLLKRCLQNNEHCMIKCKQTIDEFIDCVDAQRTDVIRERYEEKKMREEKEKQKRMKDLLKNRCLTTENIT